MSRSDPAPPVPPHSERSLIDLPLHSERAFPHLFRQESKRPFEVAETAGLGSRAVAFAADMATILLLCATAILAAGALRGEWPSSAGLPWAVAFGLVVSFFTTVPPLLLFGRTVGMALVGLTARRAVSERRLRAGAAVARWLGTLATAATLGLPLLFTAWSSNAPTPADRFSGRTLVEEDVLNAA